MLVGMVDGARPLDEALSTVQRMLDRLTQRGQHDAAFEIARAQFSASLRASWPGNLASIAKAIDAAIADGKLDLDEHEKAELQRAAEVLRSVTHP
jgi:transcriptional regulator of acetoin/glycerol metabolism